MGACLGSKARGAGSQSLQRSELVVLALPEMPRSFECEDGLQFASLEPTCMTPARSAPAVGSGVGSCRRRVPGLQRIYFAFHDTACIVTCSVIIS